MSLIVLGFIAFVLLVVLVLGYLFAIGTPGGPGR